MTEIAILLNCSVHKIVYWMDKYNLKRRTLSEALYLKLNPDGEPFKIKTDLNKKEIFLRGLGLGIYWGEGEKISKGLVRVTNTDPAILRMFRRFLLDISQLKEHKLLYQLICFNDSDPQEAKRYWAKELKISEAKFGKIVQIPSQGKGTYRKKSHYGVCVLAVANIKLKSWIMEKIEKLKKLPL